MSTKKLIRVIIDEDDWGAGYLKRPPDASNPDKKCCLGFACLALGINESELEYPPSDCGGDTFNTATGPVMPEDVGVENFDVEISDKLRRMIKESKVMEVIEPELVVATAGAVAAEANDLYHDITGTISQKDKNELLKIMRQAFREAGFQFYLKRSKS